jgi:hypothetical protein
LLGGYGLVDAAAHVFEQLTLAMASGESVFTVPRKVTPKITIKNPYILYEEPGAVNSNFDNEINEVLWAAKFDLRNLFHKWGASFQGELTLKGDYHVTESDKIRSFSSVYTFK